MRILISILLGLLAVSCASNGARAQASYQVVAACGTPPVAPAVGAVRTGYMDQTGRVCGASTISGGGDATAANQVLQIAQETAFNTALGVQADAACATDNGACGLLALVKRGNQRLTSVITALGTPMQATGGTVGLVAGTAIVGKFGIDQTTPGTTNLVALAANQSVNVAQINGVTPLMGNGATGTGALRVSIANDSTGIVGLPAAGTSVVGTKAAGTAAATSVLGGAVYNATPPTLTDGQQAAAQADTAGSRQINTEGKKATYSASAAVVLAASATDVFTITGSASKTIRVNRIAVTGKATAASVFAVDLSKRSTANTGGTSSAATAVPHDSASAAASATVLSYSANPTLGSLIGTVRLQLLAFTIAATTPFPPSPLVWDFTTRNGQAVVLRGITQVLALSLEAQTVTGGAVFVEIEWTEE